MFILLVLGSDVNNKVVAFNDKSSMSVFIHRL